MYIMYIQSYLINLSASATRLQWLCRWQ